MLRGGVSGIADSRLENIERMRSAGIGVPFMLLRLPPLSKVERVIASTNVSLNSELAVLRNLSMAARGHQRVHDVILMVDLGDLREGLWPDELLPAAGEVLKLHGVRLRGVGTNLSCFGGVIPTRENMNQLVSLVESIEQTFAVKMEVISGLNSSGLALLAAGGMPGRVNHARIGEAILLGRETTERRPWPDTHQDAFLLHAEVLELKSKPSLPLGPRRQDAFGAECAFEDRGTVPRALLNVGREDVDPSCLEPLDPRLRILGASSGYLVVDTSALQKQPGTGDIMTFSLGYSALLRAMTSEYVRKRFTANDAP